jgi:hypothetical protein
MRVTRRGPQMGFISRRRFCRLLRPRGARLRESAQPAVPCADDGDKAVGRRPPGSDVGGLRFAQAALRCSIRGRAAKLTALTSFASFRQLAASLMYEARACVARRPRLCAAQRRRSRPPTACPRPCIGSTVGEGKDATQPCLCRIQPGHEGKSARRREEHAVSSRSCET